MKTKVVVATKRQRVDECYKEIIRNTPPSCCNPLKNKDENSSDPFGHLLAGRRENPVGKPSPSESIVHIFKKKKKKKRHQSFPQVSGEQELEVVW